MPNGRGPAGPSRAKDGLVIAVDVAEMRRCWVSGEQAGCLVERDFERGALGATGFVPAGDEDHPFCGPWNFGIGGEQVFVVVQGDRVDAQGSDFGSGCGDWGLYCGGDGGNGGDGGWEVGFCG